MIKVTVNINGKDYNLKGRDNETYLKQVAEFVDGKISEITSKNKFLSTGDAAVLAAVNIADDLYENDIEYKKINKIKVSLEERNQTLSDTIKELRERIEVIQEEKSNEVSILNEKMGDNNKKIEKLYEVNKELDEKLKKINEHNNNLRNEVNKLNTELDAANKLNVSLNNEKASLKFSKKSLEERIKKEDEKNNKLQKMIEKMSKEKEESKKVISEGKYNESILTKELDGIKKENLKLKEELKKVKNSNNNLLVQIEDRKKEINNLKNNNEDLTLKIQEKNQEIENKNKTELSLKEEMENEKITQKEIMDMELGKKDTLIKELEDKVNKLLYEKRKILENGKTARNELRDSKYRILDLEKKIIDVQIEMSKMKRDKDILKK